MVRVARWRLCEGCRSRDWHHVWPNL